MELTGMGQIHVIRMHKMLALLMSPLLAQLMIMSDAIFNQLQDKFNWGRPSSSFWADIYIYIYIYIYTELVAFITEYIME